MDLPADKNEIKRALTLLTEPGQVVELRSLNVSTPAYRAPHTVSGYFTDWNLLADAAANVGQYAPGVYITLNPVNPALKARAYNRVKAVGKNDLTTGDADVVKRLRLLVDIDAKRPAGVSSTDAEHTAALVKAVVVCDWLKSIGWPAPMRADSGNGGHLVYAVDLPADDGGLVQRVLQALASKFDDGVTDVDITVFNPARITKLYGTMVRKGDDIPDYPNRMARILEAPTVLEVVSREMLEAVAAMVPAQAAPAKNTVVPQTSAFSIDAWIADYHLDVTEPRPLSGGGRKWIFNTCPWNTDHKNGSAFIVERANGALAAGCQHHGCADKDWHALRDTVEPGWRARREAAQAARAATSSAKRNVNKVFVAPVVQKPTTVITVPVVFASATSSTTPTGANVVELVEPEPEHIETESATVPNVVAWDGAVMTWNDLADFKAAHGLRQGEYTITPVWVPALNQENTYGK
jgi:hypothetical protein